MAKKTKKASLHLIRVTCSVRGRQRYREIAPLFSVANSKQEFQALLITKGGVRGDVGGEMQGVCNSSYGGMEKFLTGRTCASIG